MQHQRPTWPVRALALAAAALLAPVLGASAAAAAPFYYIDPVTPYGEIVNQTYQWMMWIGIVILIAVETLLVFAIIKFRKRPGEERQPESWSHNTTLEIVWTVIPFAMLIIICVPTFKGIAYLADVPQKPDLTLEVVGRQFFWEYRYPELGATFSSAMRTEATMNITPGNPEWDKMALYMPVGRKMVVKMTGADVIHSWWVPAFGLQQMTTPANLVQVPLEITKAGDYTGACAYLCGPYHGAMDIKIKAVDAATFDTWVAAHKATSEPDPITKIGHIGATPPPPGKHGQGGAHGEPAASAAPAAVDAKALAAAGEKIYNTRCASCHQAGGVGLPGAIPPLAGAEQVNGPDEEFIDIVLKGKSGPIKVKGMDYNSMMPPVSDLTNEEVAAVTTYVRSNWGNNGKPIAPDQVKARR